YPKRRWQKHGTQRVHQSIFTQHVRRYTQVYGKTVIPAGIAGIQITWTYLSSSFRALDTRFPAGMTNYVGTSEDE
ncbi:MAG: hypothetical protein PHD39_04640, partial [Methylobacter tundripaludum]|nr:hypothetical protein [Methylobacter tundripaludum]